MEMVAQRAEIDARVLVHAQRHERRIQQAVEGVVAHIECGPRRVQVLQAVELRIKPEPLRGEPALQAGQRRRGEIQRIGQRAGHGTDRAVDGAAHHTPAAPRRQPLAGINAVICSQRIAAHFR
jgi:hypothetical protein